MQPAAGVVAVTLVTLVTVVMVVGADPEPPPHLLLLLDASASMASQNRIEKMNVAVRGWIENLAPEGIKLSLWKFITDAVEIKSTVLDSNPISRKDIVNYLPEVESGSSCVSCAIETILKHVTTKCTILLITDGNDKLLEHDINDLSEKIKMSKCRIIAVLMGNSLDHIHLLQEITQGSVILVPDSNTVLGLLDALQATLLTLKEYKTPINIYEEEFSSAEENFISMFVVDSTIVQNLCISLYYWPYTMSLSVNLINPYGGKQQIPNEELKSGNMKYCQQFEMVGTWEVHMSSVTFNKFMAIQVTANKTIPEIDSDITLDCWIHMKENVLAIIGSVHPGKFFINETKISVDIIAKDGEVTKQNLLEIYPGSHEKESTSNLFLRKHLNIRETGYYSARCWAVGQLWKVANIETKPEKFIRVSWGGTLHVHALYNTSLYPSEITDLFAFEEIDAETCFITMEFTVPWNAIKYKLTFSSSLYDMLSGEELILSTVPGIPGTKQKITLRVPPRFLTKRYPLFIAVSGTGEQGVDGELSNVVQIMCHRNEMETSSVSSPEMTFPDDINLISHITVKNYMNHTIALTTPSSRGSLLPEHHSNRTSSRESFNFTSPVSLQEQVSSLTEINTWTTPLEISPLNTSDMTDSNSTATMESYEDSFIIQGIGILVGVLLVVVAVVLTYHTIYIRRRCESYEIAPKENQLLNPVNAQENLEMM